ncbi:MAG: substrate-binding domain-containing protein, partial [Candidatus Odinarchaeota archaeon]
MKKDAIIAAVLAIVLLVVAIVSATLIMNLPNLASRSITLATTTSTDNSGLLDYLHPYMTGEIGLKVDVVAVGTGASLEQGRQGLADVVIVHARSLEDEFVEEGYGIHRVDLMYNDFIIVGPPDDPAGIQGLINSTEIFQKLYQNHNSITFASRGDNSGTHVKELFLWEAAGVTINSDDTQWAAENDWYLETGSGMSATLTVANELSTYTLTDRGTWLFTKENYDLLLIAEKAPEWANPYGVILVNPDKFEPGSIKFDDAKRYVQW